jgi:hypothetical protein
LTPVEAASSFGNHAIVRSVTFLPFFGAAFRFGDVEGGELCECFASSAMTSFDGAVVIFDDCIAGGALTVIRLDVPRHRR